VKLKDLLSENVLGQLPSSKLMKMKWNPVTGKKNKVNEGLKSNIMQKWDTTKVIERDLVDYLKSAMDASGEELVQDIQTVLKKVANLRIK
jgi:hypothetical protein